MSNAAQTIVTMGILSGLGYAVYKSRQEQIQAENIAQQISYQPASTGGTSSLKNALLGSLGGFLGDALNNVNLPTNGSVENVTESTAAGGFGDWLGSLLGGTTLTGGAGSTDYGLTTGAPSIGGTGGRLKADFMRDFGFTSNQAAGIVGNLHLESAGFSSLQEIQPMEWQNGVLVPSDTNLGGYGYAQWTGPRRRAFESWAGQQGLSVDSYAANYGFLRYEMSSTWEKRVVSRIRNTQSVADSTRVFMSTYLRPGIEHLSTRISYAERYA